MLLTVGEGEVRGRIIVGGGTVVYEEKEKAMEGEEQCV